MIGAIICAIAAILFVIGVAVVVWDWAVRSEPDAPHGGPIVAVAVVSLLCGGIISCSETVKDVREIKQNQRASP